MRQPAVVLYHIDYQSISNLPRGVRTLSLSLVTCRLPLSPSKLISLRSPSRWMRGLLLVESVDAGAGAGEGAASTVRGGEGGTTGLGAAIWVDGRGAGAASSALGDADTAGEGAIVSVCAEACTGRGLRRAQPRPIPTAIAAMPPTIRRIFGLNIGVAFLDLAPRSPRCWGMYAPPNTFALFRAEHGSREPLRMRRFLRRLRAMMAWCASWVPVPAARGRHPPRRREA